MSQEERPGSLIRQLGESTKHTQNYRASTAFFLVFTLASRAFFLARPRVSRHFLNLCHIIIHIVFRCI